MSIRFALVLLFAIFMVGCSSTEEKKDEAVVEDLGATSTSNATDTSETQTHAAQQEGRSDMSALDDPNSPLATRIIYFDFDSSEVRSDYRAVVDAHAAFLAAHPNVSITLEGHADERGSREYNLALGERRAQSVKQQMTIQGVNASQISTVSYGEERPAVDGHDEYAWSQNRRVEIVYKK